MLHRVFDRLVYMEGGEFTSSPRPATRDRLKRQQEPDRLLQAH